MNKFVKIYTPLIIAVFTVLNAVLFLFNDAQRISFALGGTFGNSLLVTIYIWCVSRKMCIWYKMNLICLFITQILGILYNFFKIKDVMYLYYYDMFHRNFVFLDIP